MQPISLPYYTRISELSGFLDIAEDRVALEAMTGQMVSIEA